MVKISVEIDVHNPSEIIESKKGKFKRVMAGLFMSRRTIKRTVEAHMAAEIVKALTHKIEEELQNEGVKAHLKVQVEKE